MSDQGCWGTDKECNDPERGWREVLLRQQRGQAATYLPTSHSMAGHQKHCLMMKQVLLTSGSPAICEQEGQPVQSSVPGDRNIKPCLPNLNLNFPRDSSNYRRERHNIMGVWMKGPDSNWWENASVSGTRIVGKNEVKPTKKKKETTLPV